MVQSKKNERVNALKEVQHFCKEFSFTNDILKELLTEGKR
jgi:hypothetical protein